MEIKEKASVLLPIKENMTLELPHFPTRLQAVVFRLWEMVDASKIAEVLETTKDNITEMAMAMGLPKQKNTDEWLEKGYITIIKNLWHLLPYEQICQVLGWNEDRLAYTIKEDDVLFVKLGGFKPYCEKLVYRQLTEKEKEETEKIKEVIEKEVKKDINGIEKLPFDFVDSIYPVKKISSENINSREVVIDDSWSVNFPQDNPEILTAVEIFCDDFYDSWGIQLQKNADTQNRIDIVVLERPKEYHKISLEEKNIKIEASKDGVLRALILLLDKAQAEGGPFYKKAVYEKEAVFHTRFLYSYCGLYAQAFDYPPEFSYPEKMLKEYAKLGINGIWTQAVLYQLIEFPFEPSVSEGWKTRLANLKKLVQMAKKYGIKLYLYLNEPRSMPLSFFDKHPDMKGQVQGDYACICTSSEKGRKYLYDAVHTLCKEVPDLGGFFVISRSENLTNCYSLVRCEDSSIPCDDINCPRCAKRKAHEVVAEINTIVTQAAHAVNKDIKVIAWPWAWTGPDFTPENVEKGIKLIPEINPVMEVSEDDSRLCIGGVKNVVRDYSMAHIGPSETTKKIWKIAKESNHETFAKLQINTTWECSTCPSLPVYRLVIEHLENVKKENVSGLMLGWTLGGYPSANLKIASGSFFDDLRGNEKNPYEEILKSIYRSDYERVKKATDLFCEGFKQFPFNHPGLYNAPHNAGVSNLLYEKPTGYTATMTCFSYDDLDNWRMNYPADVFENQYGKIIEKWEEGLSLIENMENSEFKDVSIVGYSLFKSTYEQIRFVRARERFLNNDNTEEMKKIMLDAAQNEFNLAERVYQIMRRNPSIGYEAANHYYFNQTMVLEKMINCRYLMEKLGIE